jgi:hypothetical protein
MPKYPTNWLKSLDLTLRWLALSFLCFALFIFAAVGVARILAEVPNDVQYDSVDSEQDLADQAYFYQ